MLINCHSYYSLNYGCLSVVEVIDTIKKLGHTQFAITDINNTSETFRFLKLANEQGLKLTVGIDFRNGVEQQYIGLAHNQEGFFELNKFLSEYSSRKEDFPPVAPYFEHVTIVYPLHKLSRFNTLKNNELYGVNAIQLKYTWFTKIAKKHYSKMVVLYPATFRHKRDFNAHRLLRAIGENTLLSKLPKTEQASPTDLYLDTETIETQFADYPELLNNTRVLLNKTVFEFNFGGPKNNKKSFTESPEKDMVLLRELSEQGLPYRYGKKEEVGQVVLDRLESELRLIEQCGFCAYFLINWDLANYARSKNYPYVGRGSGANSMVAYLLRITNVDPIDLDLYFERFINPYRSSPPDFDVDFSWADREDVTQYLFDKYGWDKVALLGSYVTYQRRAVVRELGKVFGLPDEEIKKIQHAEKPPEDEYSKLVQNYSRYIAGFPSHLSVHASGIIISEKPVHYYSATHLPPKNYPTTHFDMHISEDVGLNKYDILSQRGLGKIKDAVEMVYVNHHQFIDIDEMEMIKTDPEVKRLLRAGDLSGCFYVESPAMRMLMTKLKAEDYTRLVAASSIIRPGVAKSGMMREYILRFQDVKRRAAAQKALPKLYEILEETYGVMVYQEDVIKVAHRFAGLSLADADVLRRGMSWKFKERVEFREVRDKFFEGCKTRGYDAKTIDDIWLQIESFANYAFSKGHSASYAVESFQAIYLYAYYPLEYLTATLNNGGGFYSRELYVHMAKMKGAVIALPSVNNSEVLCTLQGKTIHIGLGFIGGGFERENIRAILDERSKNGLFASFRDFVDRMPKISLEQVLILIRIGCFRAFEPNKKKLLWDAHFLLGETSQASHPSVNLFQVKPKTWTLPDLSHTQLEDAYDEIEFLGFPVSMKPFDMVAERRNLLKFTAADLKRSIKKKVEIVGYRVHIKRHGTAKGKMQFGTFIDQEGRWIDAVIFPNAYKPNLFSAPGCYLLSGVVTEEFGHVSLEVSYAKRLDTTMIYG